jgi:hypothetical protein
VSKLKIWYCRQLAFSPYPCNSATIKHIGNCASIVALLLWYVERTCHNSYGVYFPFVFCQSLVEKIWWIRKQTVASLIVRKWWLATP